MFNINQHPACVNVWIIENIANTIDGCSRDISSITHSQPNVSFLPRKYLLKQSTDTLSKRKDEFAGAGLSSEEIEKKIFWDALAVNAMKKWKSVHKPITIIFAFSATLHILIIFLFWGWK